MSPSPSTAGHTPTSTYGLPTPSVTWLQPYFRDEAAVRNAASALVLAADQFADALQRHGVAIGQFSPGDGYVYRVALTSVTRPDWPGTLVVAMPDYHVCLLVDLPGFMTPNYVDEKIRDERLAVVLAVLINLISNRLH